jgi:hypothetical protein
MHATTKARRDEQSLSFLCSRLMLTGEESLLFATEGNLEVIAVILGLPVPGFISKRDDATRRATEAETTRAQAKHASPASTQIISNERMVGCIMLTLGEYSGGAAA